MLDSHFFVFGSLQFTSAIVDPQSYSIVPQPNGFNIQMNAGADSLKSRYVKLQQRKFFVLTICNYFEFFFKLNVNISKVKLRRLKHPCHDSQKDNVAANDNSVFGDSLAETIEALSKLWRVYCHCI